MSKINEELSSRLKNTFRNYIRHAVEHALDEEESENDVLQVIVNLQASLELLSKLYVLQCQGWQGIVSPKFHNKSESELLIDIENGALKTTEYKKNKDFIANEIYLNDDDKSLLDGFHNRRNQIMHLGVINPPREVLYEAIWFIVRIIHQLPWQDALPMNQQCMSNSLELLLGKQLYKALLHKSCYVDEAVDRAYELYPRSVKLCLECGSESWVVNESGYRICLVCGFRGDENAFGFIDCPVCQSKGSLVYDPLNIEVNDRLNGLCCACRKIVPVTKCTKCGNVHAYSGHCKFCTTWG